MRLRQSSDQSSGSDTGRRAYRGFGFRSAQMLLETFTAMNDEMGATILMVTHDAFSASYCSRILFLKDGEIFHELVKGAESRREFLNEILDVLSLTGGEGSCE